MTTQDQNDIDELANQLKGFDKQLGATATDERAPTPAPAQGVQDAPATPSADQRDIAALQANMGMIPMTTDPCASCGDKTCTVRGMGLSSINCKTITVVGPGGILKNVDR